MKNNEFIKQVIHCRDCIHRETLKCPMYQYNYDFDFYEDVTEDSGFCQEGERNDY